MKTMTARMTYVAAGVLASIGTSHATASYDFGDITNWIGSGDSEVALVIDWNDGHSTQSRAWGFRFDGTMTAEDMFLSVVAADSALFAKVGIGGEFGVPLFGIGYDTNADGFGLDDGSIFDDDGFTVSDEQHADGASALDPLDQYQEGWLTDGFWAEYRNSTDDTGAHENPYTSGAWEFGGGLAFDTISDGGWIGLSYAPGFDFTPPSQPVPAPAALWILGAAFARTSRQRS